MSNYIVITFLSILWLAITIQSAPSLKSKRYRCGCFAMCDKKYNENDVFSTEAQLNVSACRRGCRYYHVMARLPHKNKDPTLTAAEADEAYCTESCRGIFPFSGKEKMACLDGCRNGCDLGGMAQARVRVTIYVEDESSDGADGELASDPAFRHQIEAHIISAPEEDKIPASYYINLPIARDNEDKCCQPKLCDWDIEGGIRSKFFVGVLLMFGITTIYYVVTMVIQQTSPEENNLPNKKRSVIGSDSPTKTPLLPTHAPALTC